MASAAMRAMASAACSTSSVQRPARNPASLAAVAVAGSARFSGLSQPCGPQAARISILSRGQRVVAKSQGSGGEKPVNYNKEFGYSRKDVLLIGGGLIGLGYAMYYGLQATGMEPGIAGNWVQLIIFLGICVGWVSTYLFRVATKQMTYVKQLEQYEEAVMRKRLEEMTPEELEALAKEAEEARRKP